MDYHLHDLFAIQSEKSRRFTIEESKEFLLENFSFSEDLAEMMTKRSIRKQLSISFTT